MMTQSMRAEKHLLAALAELIQFFFQPKILDRSLDLILPKAVSMQNLAQERSLLVLQLMPSARELFPYYAAFPAYHLRLAKPPSQG